MGFGTSYTYDEYISRKLFKSKIDIEDYIEELEDDLNNYERDFLTYAVSDPKNIPDSDSEVAIVDAVKFKITDLLEIYNETIIDLYKVKNYLEVFDPKKINDDTD